MKRKKRSTLAKKIRKAATLDAAFDIAAYGAVRAPIETQAALYLHLLKCYKWVKGQTTVNPMEMLTLPSVTESCIHTADELCSLVLDAVDARDGDTLRKLADFVETWSDAKPWEDPRRALILTLKQGLAAKKVRMTIAELAKALRLPADAEVDSLRVLAKELGFPLAESRVGRPRETPTNKRSSKA